MEFVGLQDTYTVVRAVGSGSSAVVYEARRSSDGTLVAVKDFQARLDSTQRFLSEVRLQRRLVHPGVVPLIDVVVASDEASSTFLVMPLSEEGSIKGLMPPARAFVPFEEAMVLLEQIAAAIDYVHSQGIVHGDIKPENILIFDGGSRLALCDFGISRNFDTHWCSTMIGSDGTPDYMSPEQVDRTGITVKSDVYSLAMIAYQILAGAKPYPVDASLRAILNAKAEGHLADPSTINPVVSPLVGRVLLNALSPDPAMRPASAGALCNELRSANAMTTEQLAIEPGPKDAMAGERDVFISYSTRDKAIADAVCAGLEAKATRCWIAPRDVLPGEDWPSAIARAIKRVGVVVLVLSDNADASSDVRREVNLAMESGATIIPFRVDQTQGESFRYALADRHWLDAMTPPLEAHIAKLADTIGLLLK